MDRENHSTAAGPSDPSDPQAAPKSGSAIYDSGRTLPAAGSLFVVATPIGHIEDITLRALSTLKLADWIACEDTRRTLKLLNHYGISKPLLTVFGPKEKRASGRILELLRCGKSVALLTDAGTPGVSDPGHRIVRAAKEGGLPVLPVPGASALAAAVSVCGRGDSGFIFLGFLPRKKSKIKRLLTQAAGAERPIFFYESPYRLLDTLETVAETFGKEAFIWIGREMTKRFEEYLSGPAAAVLERLRGREILGEITVLVEP